MKIDFSEQSAVLEGKVIEFTPKEYRTLFLFVKNPHIILTKRQLIEKLWDIDGDFIDEHTLTTIISRIRKKIETDERKYIKTAYGMGYQWIGGEARMKLQNLSTRTFLRLIVGSASLTSILLLFILYAFTKDIKVILGGFSVMILLFFWGVIFLHYFQKKL